MNGITAVQGSMNVQTPSAPTRSRAPEEATESQTEKVRETRQGEESRGQANPKAPNGVGTLLDLVA